MNLLSLFRAVLRISFAVVILVSFAFLFACGKSAETNGEPSNGSIQPPVNEESNQTEVTPWNPDGILSTGEYTGTSTFAGNNYEIRWRTEDTFIYIGLRVRTTGWVAVGLNVTDRMRNADLIFGYVANNEVAISDQFSTGINGPHQPDDELGGEQNIDIWGGREEGGYTIIELKRLLETNDEFDARLMPGTIRIIWSYGSSDNITVQHVNRGYGEINI